MSLPALQPPCPSADSSARILKEASGVEPGWVEIMPRKRVTDHVRTWLLSAQTGEQEGGQQVRPAMASPPPHTLEPQEDPHEGVPMRAPMNSSPLENAPEHRMAKNPLGSASRIIPEPDLT